MVHLGPDKKGAIYSGFCLILVSGTKRELLQGYSKSIQLNTMKKEKKKRKIHKRIFYQVYMTKVIKENII